jgi:hypothetical protein
MPTEKENHGRRAMSQNEKRAEFEKAVRPAMKWLGENHHPHMSIVLDSGRAELVEASMSYQTVEFIDGAMGKPVATPVAAETDNEQGDRFPAKLDPLHRLLLEACKRAVKQISISPDWEDATNDLNDAIWVAEVMG